MSCVGIWPMCGLLVIGILTFNAKPALAWSTDGRRIVAEVANSRLSPEASRTVRDLLAVVHKKSLVDVAAWGAEARAAHPGTRPWFYVDIPISEQGYDATRDCVNGECVIAKIAEYRTVLANSAKPKRERLEALEYLVAFVGDIHQPLRCSNNGDRGGRDVRVRGYSDADTLSAVWDSGIIRAANLADPAASKKLNARIRASEAKAWARGTITDWANECHGVAQRFVYTHQPDTSGNLPPNYQNEAAPIVELQLEKAGVRLAALLNSTLK